MFLDLFLIYILSIYSRETVRFTMGWKWLATLLGLSSLFDALEYKYRQITSYFLAPTQRLPVECWRKSLQLDISRLFVSSSSLTLCVKGPITVSLSKCTCSVWKSGHPVWCINMPQLYHTELASSFPIKESDESWWERFLHLDWLSFTPV